MGTAKDSLILLFDFPACIVIEDIVLGGNNTTICIWLKPCQTSLWFGYQVKICVSELKYIVTKLEMKRDTGHF